MEMDQPSIFKGTKKVLGVADNDTSFDFDILMCINSAFATLAQLGVGPADNEGYIVEDESIEWEDFFGEDPIFNLVKPYVFLATQMLFDPPTTSFMIDLKKTQISELESRIAMHREWLLNPVDPMPLVVIDD